MSSKVSFRARTVDSSRPLPIYRAEELPEGGGQGGGAGPSLTVPTGMEKAEEGEKHLADILALDITLDTGLVIPTPGCSEIQSGSTGLSQETQAATVSNVYDKVNVTPIKRLDNLTIATIFFFRCMTQSSSSQDSISMSSHLCPKTCQIMILTMKTSSSLKRNLKAEEIWM